MRRIEEVMMPDAILTGQIRTEKEPVGNISTEQIDRTI